MAQEEVYLSFWRNRRVFVTGAAGLVGAQLCQELFYKGAEVIALVRDLTSATDLPEESLFAAVHGDVTDLSLIRRVLAEYEVDTVFHLAAQTIVSIANRDPWSSWESNIRGTYTLMEACRIYGRTRRVVVASTDKVYGQSAVLPTPETEPLLAEFPYEVSKACADMVARSYYRTFGVDSVLTRCGNIFGPGDINWNRLVPGTIRSAIQGERPVIRSDGSLMRDYIHVDEIISGYLTVAEMGEPGEAYNISDGQFLSVLRMTQLVLSACGRPDLQPIVLGEPVKEIQAQYLNSDKIRALGWEARHPFQERLKQTYHWYQELIEG